MLMSDEARKVVLLVEDSPGDARLLREMLGEQRSSRMEAVHVGSMSEAEAYLGAHAVDLILLDPGLPDAQGLDAVQRAHAAALHVPLVVLTGLDDESLAVRALQEGAQDYLIKDQIDTRGLLRALRYAIERKAMEEALFAEKGRAQVTLNCIADAVACTDVAGNLTFLNAVAENLTGWSLPEAAGRPMADVFRIVDSVNHEVIPNPMALAVGRNQTMHLPPNSMLVPRNGPEIPIEDSVAPMRDREGQACGAVIVLRDVSAARAMARQMAETAADLAKQNALLSRVNGELTALVHSSPIAIYATDRDGIVTMWSPAAERLSGFAAEEAIGRFLPIVPDDAIEDAREGVRRVCAGETASSVLLTRRKKDGTIVELSVSTGPLTDESGVARGAMSLAENVTEEVSQRRRIERMQSEFVATVSHELRTPLTSIGGSLGLVVGGAAGVLGERAARLIEIANNNTQRLIRLVNDILDIEKLQSGRMAFRFAPLRVDDIIGQAVSANLGFAASFGIEIRSLGKVYDAVVKADPDRLNQALTNLLSNAVKFSPAGGSVEICAVRAPHGVRISVTDHGPGIPEEFRARIFDRFAQADSSDIRQRGGSGLGLNIVREIVQRHGGSVSFDSEVGRGASFHIDLPVLAGQEVLPTRPREPTGSFLQTPLSERPAILHVEDDPSILAIVRHALRDEFRVVAALSLRSARRRLAEQRFDLVILDLTLSDGLGKDLISALVDTAGHPIPTLVFTGEDANPELAVRVEAILTKSRDSLSMLVETVRSVLAAKDQHINQFRRSRGDTQGALR